MSQIRAVLFDFGGTLYDYRSLIPGDLEAFTTLARTLGIEAAAADIGRAHLRGLRNSLRKYLLLTYYDHRDLFADAVRSMAAEFGAEIRDEQLAEHFKRQWAFHARDFQLRDGVVETLTSLRDRGLHLGIVSNIDDDQLAHLGALARLEDHFDSVLSSQAIRSCKPHRRIFLEALGRAGCEPGEALFVGDSREADVAGANAVGCISVLLWSRDDFPVPDGEPRAAHVIRRIPEVYDLVDRHGQ